MVFKRLFQAQLLVQFLELRKSTTGRAVSPVNLLTKFDLQIKNTKEHDELGNRFAVSLDTFSIAFFLWYVFLSSFILRPYPTELSRLSAGRVPLL